jgi:hypothetical protein
VDARAVRHPNETVDAVSRQRDLRIRCTLADGAGAALASRHGTDRGETPLASPTASEPNHATRIPMIANREFG